VSRQQFEPEDVAALQDMRVNQTDLKLAQEDAAEGSVEEPAKQDADHADADQDKKKPQAAAQGLAPGAQPASSQAQAPAETEAGAEEKENQGADAKKEEGEKSDEGAEGSKAHSLAAAEAGAEAGSESTSSASAGAWPYGRQKYNRRYFQDRKWREKGREEGDYGFDEPAEVENHTAYRKKMDQVLGISRGIERTDGWRYPYQYGYYNWKNSHRYANYPYGYSNNSYYNIYGYGKERYNPFGAADDPFLDDGKDDKEFEGYYPRAHETEDELFVHDLHRFGYEIYKDQKLDAGAQGYGGYYNPYARTGGAYGGYNQGGYNYGQNSGAGRFGGGGDGGDSTIANKRAERADYDERKRDRQSQ